MKLNCLRIAPLAALLSCAYLEPQAQANPALSNLTSTAVNADLLPGAAGTLRLGSSLASWKDFYLSHFIFLGGNPFINSGGAAAGQNTGVGRFSLAGINSGIGNTGFGDSALSANTAGNNNVALGAGSLNKTRSGSSNAGVGTFTLYQTTTGTANAALGNYALYGNTSGNDNLAAGDSALASNSVGKANVAVGVAAMYHNTGNSFQVAIGDAALFNIRRNSVGNTAIGNQAMSSQLTGSNTGIGASVGRLNTSANITAFGALAMETGTGSSEVVVIGRFAKHFSLPSSGDVAVGDSAMDQSYGQANTGLGKQTLYRLQSGRGNVAAGRNALFTITNGNYNVGIGDRAGPQDQDIENTENTVMIGRGATNGSIAVGDGALTATPGGYVLTGLGAGSATSSPDVSFSVSLGAGSIATASEQIMLGDVNVTSVVAAGSFMIYSDGRFKQNVKADIPGLNFLKTLRPVSYHYDVHGIDQVVGAPVRKRAQLAAPPQGPAIAAAFAREDAAREAAMNAKEKKLYTGFIAQEVEAAAKKNNYPFSGLHTPQNDKDLYALGYSDFVPTLVKSVQELDKSDSADDAVITELTGQLDSARQELARVLQVLKTMPGHGKVSGASPPAANPVPFRQQNGVKPAKETAKNNSTTAF